MSLSNLWGGGGGGGGTGVTQYIQNKKEMSHDQVVGGDERLDILKEKANHALCHGRRELERNRADGAGGGWCGGSAAVPVVPVEPAVIDMACLVPATRKKQRRKKKWQRTSERATARGSTADRNRASDSEREHGRQKPSERERERERKREKERERERE